MEDVLDVYKLPYNPDIPVLVDTSGSRLIAAVKEKPLFIKPNEDEIAQLTGHCVSGREDAVRAYLTELLPLATVLWHTSDS